MICRHVIWPGCHHGHKQRLSRWQCTLTSYMTGCSKFSMMERRPLAPVPRSRAAWAIARLADSVMCMRAPLMPNIRSYCFESAFLGLVRTSISCASVKVYTRSHMSAHMRINHTSISKLPLTVMCVCALLMPKIFTHCFNSAFLSLVKISISCAFLNTASHLKYMHYELEQGGPYKTECIFSASSITLPLLA